MGPEQDSLLYLGVGFVIVVGCLMNEFCYSSPVSVGGEGTLGP